MKRNRVYISFDFDNDKGLKDLFIGQSRNQESPFEVYDHSLKEEAPERHWEEKAEEKMRRADQVIVLLGPETHRAPGVLKEIRIARRLEKKIVQLIGYRKKRCRRIPGAGVLYHWTWDNLKKILN